jgi:predicted ATP-grasp superfamily ATP-dependent carboligase
MAVYLTVYYSRIFPIIFQVLQYLSLHRGIPAPEAAAIILETLAKVTSYEELRIDVGQLGQQGDRVKKNLQKFANSIRNQQKSINENETGQSEEKLT